MYPIESEEHFPDSEYYDEVFSDLEPTFPAQVHIFQTDAWQKFLVAATLFTCVVLAALFVQIPASASFETNPDRDVSIEKGAVRQNAHANQPDPDPQSPEANLTEQELTADFTDCQVSQRFPASILEWCGLITHYATRRGLPPNLVAALILQESGGNPVAYSKSGAVGLMQVMPRDGLAASFMCVNGPCFANRPNIAELQNPEFNISYGTKMLSGLVGKHGNFREALKSYGPMSVGYYYADKVIGIFQRYGN